MISEFLKNPSEQSVSAHCASVFVRSNKVFVCWYVYPEVEHKNAKIVLSKSLDEGNTFSSSVILFPRQPKSQGNPVIFEAADQLMVVYSVISDNYWNDAQLYYSLSDDEGESWSEPLLLDKEKGLMARHPPVEINGKTVFPLYDEKDFSSSLYYFDTKNFSLEKFYSFEGSLIQPQIICGDNETAVFFRTSGSDFHVWKAKMAGDETQWESPKELDLNCPKSGIAAARIEGKNLIVFNNTPDLRRYPLSMVMQKTSKDGELSNIYDFDQNPIELSYPSLVSANEKVHLVYSYNRRMIKYMRLENISKHFSYESDLKSFKNLHMDKNLFILASGPSLADLDLSPLDRRLTMGLNRSFLIYPDTKYHCTMDARLFDEYSTELEASRVLFSLHNCSLGNRLKLLGTEGFSTDIAEGIYSGYTISYFALQVAVYMGFKKVFFLGLDLKHREGNTHFFGSDFRSRDHEKGEFSKMEKMLHLGALKAKELGVEVYNCSELTDFKGIETMSFEKALCY